MTEKDFLRKGFRAFQEIIYKNKRMEDGVLCTLVGIDFDNHALILCPFPDGYHLADDFYASIEHCYFPKDKIEFKVKTFSDGKLSVTNKILLPLQDSRFKNDEHRIVKKFPNN